MAGPGGKEVGRVSIRVVPDTEKFRQRLKKSLEKETKGLKVKIPVELEGITKAETKLKEATRDRKAKIKVETTGDKLDDIAKKTRKVKIKVEPDVMPIRGGDYIDETKKIRVRPVVLGGDYLDETKKMRVIAEVQGGDYVDKTKKMRIIGDLDTQRLTTQLRTLRARVNVDADTELLTQRLNRATRDRTVDIDFDVDRSTLSVIDTWTRPRKIKVDVDKSSISRVGRAFQGMLDNVNPLNGALSGMSSRMKLIIAAVLVLAPLLTGLVATMVAAIPSLIAFGAALGAVGYLGWDGIKSAFSQLSGTIDNLKAKLSDTFERGLTPMMKGFKATLETLTPTLDMVAQTMVGAFGQMASVINSPEGVAAIQNILSNVAALMTQLAPTIQQGTAAFLGLANIASESFGRLGETIGTFTDQFYQFTNRMAQSGALDKAFEGLQIALDGLSVGFFKLMDAGVEAMAQVGPAVGRFFESFGNFAASAMPVLGSVLNIILDLASTLMDALAPAFKAMAPAFQKFAEMIAKITKEQGPNFAKILGSIADVLGDALLSAFQALEPVIPVLVDSFSQIADLFANYMAENGHVIVDIFTRLAEAIAELVVQIAPLLPQLVTIGIQFMEQILPTLPPIVDAFLDLALLAIPPLVEILKILLPILGYLAAGFGFIIGAIITVGKWILKFINWLFTSKTKAQDVTNAIITAFNWLKQKASEIWDLMKQAVAIAWAKIKQKIGEKLVEIKAEVKNKIRELPQIIKNSSPDWVVAGVELVLGLIRGIKSKIQDAFNAVAQLAKSMPGWAKKILGIHSPSRVFAEIGKQTVAGMTKGIEDNSDKSVKASKDMATRVKEAAVKEFQDLPQQIGQQWTQSIASDLGFSTNGAVGTLISKLMDPEFLKEENNNIYVVKDVDEAERKANTEKKRKALQYKAPGMRR